MHASARYITSINIKDRDMSHLLDQFRFFKRKQGEFADGHGETRAESRSWEDSYRNRWQYDKVVRSTHGVNCTGGCSWGIYVKEGIVTWAPGLDWRDMPLKTMVSERFEHSVFVENDVNLSTLGELNFGAGRDAHNLVCIAIGTGIGAGIASV